MKNTPPPVPIGERDTPSLIEDLCLALRNVGVYDWDLPNGERVQQQIAAVRDIKRELDLRTIQTDDRIIRLSNETNWRMQDLLQDCLTFPDTMPYVKDVDGNRRTLRCWLCRSHERPADAQVFWWCNECLIRVLQAIQQRKPLDGIILFRTYNPDARCQHADFETVLVAASDSEKVYGNCAKCMEDELTRRTSASTSA
jgi:hypothetical protein